MLPSLTCVDAKRSTSCRKLSHLRAAKRKGLLRNCRGSRASVCLPSFCFLVRGVLKGGKKAVAAAWSPTQGRPRCHIISTLAACVGNACGPSCGRGVFSSRTYRLFCRATGVGGVLLAFQPHCLPRYSRNGREPCWRRKVHGVAFFVQVGRLWKNEHDCLSGYHPRQASYRGRSMPETRRPLHVSNHPGSPRCGMSSTSATTTATCCGMGLGR